MNNIQVPFEVLVRAKNSKSWSTAKKETPANECLMDTPPRRKGRSANRLVCFLYRVFFPVIKNNNGKSSLETLQFR